MQGMKPKTILYIALLSIFLATSYSVPTFAFAEEAPADTAGLLEMEESAPAAPMVSAIDKLESEVGEKETPVKNEATDSSIPKIKTFDLPEPKAGGVEINATNFPDSIFMKYVKDNFDKDDDGILSDSEIAVVNKIDLEGEDVLDLKGVEYFTSLTHLYCAYNELTKLDVSKNIALFKLDCSYNDITDLDVSKDTNSLLTELDCTSNELTDLDVSKNAALAELGCSSNKLARLDVSKNTALSWLECSNNNLTSLDVSKNIALSHLVCSMNNLTSLNTSQNPALEGLKCDNNKLTDLDVSKNNVLKSLLCSQNNISEITLNNTKSIGFVNIEGNELSEFDLNLVSKASIIWVSDNHIPALDVSPLEKQPDKLWMQAHNQTIKGEYTKDGNKYVVDLTTIIGVNPKEVIITDDGVKEGALVTYDHVPKTMSYTYNLGIPVSPLDLNYSIFSDVMNVDVTLKEAGQNKPAEKKKSTIDFNETDTGNSIPIMLWIALALAAAAIGTTIAVRRKFSE